MSRSHLIREYGHLLAEGITPSGGDNTIPIPKVDFDFLETALYSQGTESASATGNFLRPALHKGRRSLQVRNYVGVLQTPSGTQIEILPKIYHEHGREHGVKQVRAILVRMLGFLRNSPFRQSDIALLADASIPLIEVLIGYFLQQVNTLVKRGIRSDYVSCQENIGFMKGKLLIADNIRKNLAHQHRFYVEYDEFQVNRPENRLIKSALKKIGSLITHSNNQRLCRELLFAFADVPCSDDIRADLGRCSKDRGIHYYAHVLEWCRLILLEQSPVGASGDTRSISLLFPMERIFEDYVAARLRMLFPDWQVRIQAKSHHLASQNGKKLFLMKPDLVLKKGPVKVIADTKWKLLGQDSSQPIHKSISQADLYQMYAYGKKYLGEQEKKEVYLIYPKSTGFTRPLKPFRFDDAFTLYVVPFDLSSKDNSLHTDGSCYFDML